MAPDPSSIRLAPGVVDVDELAVLRVPPRISASMLGRPDQSPCTARATPNRGDRRACIGHQRRRPAYG
jgi:hypothetical protein